ncbi:MAG: TRAP transporter large permease subunit [Syntrophaceae bacterium]|nr:TRAP transporter large permease subunit [Syntrophaceae bacterium]
MDPAWVTVFLFGSLVVFLLLGLPIAFTLGGLALLFTLFLWGPPGLLMMASHAYGESTNFILVSVPLFILMAVVLEGSGIAEDLFETMYRWFGGLPGGLLTGTIVICAIFAAMSGISGVATVTMGLIAMPAMLKRGIDLKMVVGGIMCGGALGIIIPPSVIAILYGSITGTSVGKLFMGGFVPGILIAGVMILFCTVRCIRNPRYGPPIPEDERADWREKIASLKNVIFPFLFIVLVLGVIYSGICTPTEASAIGASGAILCSLINRRLAWKSLKAAALRTLNITCMAMWIVIGAKSFASIYTAGGASDFILSLVKDLAIPPLMMIGIMQFIFFILGMFIDPVGMCMICSPVFLPIVTNLGYDPTWFGILFILNCGMAYITPPFGFNLFYMRAIAPADCTMGEIYASVWPWVICEAVVLILVMFFPGIGMWLPNRMG